MVRQFQNDSICFDQTHLATFLRNSPTTYKSLDNLDEYHRCIRTRQPI